MPSEERIARSAAEMLVEPLDWRSPWPDPWSRLEELAEEADIETEELRAYREAEVARRRAEP